MANARFYFVFGFSFATPCDAVKQESAGRRLPERRDDVAQSSKEIPTDSGTTAKAAASLAGDGVDPRAVGRNSAVEEGASIARKGTAESGAEAADETGYSGKNGPTPCRSVDGYEALETSEACPREGGDGVCAWGGYSGDSAAAVDAELGCGSAGGEGLSLVDVDGARNDDGIMEVRQTVCTGQRRWYVRYILVKC